MARARRSHPRPLRRSTRLAVGAAAAVLAATSLASCRNPPDVLTVTTVATGLASPWDLGFAPNGDLFLTERAGRIDLRVAATGELRTLAAPADVVVGGEGGMLGLAVDPGFAANRRIYTCFQSNKGTTPDVRLVRWQVNAASTALTDRTELVTGLPTVTGRHTGCRPRFGPDGYLWVGTGDAAVAANPQSPTSLGGKVLRVDTNGAAAPGNAPAPFDPRIYSYGHRNVQGLGWDAEGRLYASEFGQNTFDELNLIRPGGNYGWPQAEGRSSAEGLVSPALVWRTSEASPSGIAVTPEGTVYLAALRGERVWRTRRDGDAMATPEVVLDGLGRVRAVEVVGGQLYVLTNNTARGTPRSGDDRLLAVPLP